MSVHALATEVILINVSWVVYESTSSSGTNRIKLGTNRIKLGTERLSGCETG